MIKDNILKAKQRISEAAARAKRDPASIAIVAVTKGRNLEQVKQAMEAGICNIGENKLQEAVLKYDHLKMMNCDLSTVKWHMVGHLQMNKVKEAVKIFDLIHSVDSLRLAQEIDRQAKRMDKIQDILIEVNTSAQESKFGLRPEEATGVVKEIVRLENLKLQGLMTVAPVVDNPEKARPYFRMLRELRDEINKSQVTSRRLEDLSMGMTDDFEVAIEEGATMVRIGRAIFEG